MDCTIMDMALAPIKWEIPAFHVIIKSTIREECSFCDVTNQAYFCWSAKTPFYF